MGSLLPTDCTRLQARPKWRLLHPAAGRLACMSTRQCKCLAASQPQCTRRMLPSPKTRLASLRLDVRTIAGRRLARSTLTVVQASCCRHLYQGLEGGGPVCVSARAALDCAACCRSAGCVAGPRAGWYAAAAGLCGPLHSRALRLMSTSSPLFRCSTERLCAPWSLVQRGAA